MIRYVILFIGENMNSVNNENNGNNGNKGNKGKFSDRIKIIRIMRNRKIRVDYLENIEDKYIKSFFKNIKKVVLFLFSLIHNNITNNSFNKTNGDISYKKEWIHGHDKFSVMDEKNNIFMDITNDNNIKRHKRNLNNKVKKDEIRNIDLSSLKRNRYELLSNANLISADKESYGELEYRKIRLQKEIIDLIKKKLIVNINELEILQSEFYVLNLLETGNVYLSECQKDIKEIKKLLSKIKVLKEKYDYLKNNIDFEYMLEYDDEFLIDKILELKEICFNDEINHTVKDYKILNEYKFLYLKIDKLQEDTIKFTEEKNKKLEELKKRDIDFDKLKKDIYDVDRENDRYNSFVKEQELFLRQLQDDMFKIESHENVMYKLKGFNQLLGNSFKYLGLLLVNPLKGLIPGIVTQTIITKNIVCNLYRNLEWEENRKIIYETIDYSASINNAINNLDSTILMVDSTLEDIVKLKNRYMTQFSSYERDFSAYHEAIKKMNKIENAIFNNKIKLEIMRQKMIEKERENNNKLKMVKKLNE